MRLFLRGNKSPADYVDMFVGTSNSRWMLGPYAQVPFGMVQLGPDNQDQGWMGGYEYSISNVSGFSHIHAWTMGGLMMMPATADLSIVNPSCDSPYQGANAGYHSRILKETEIACPGYYSVFLYDHKVEAELSATAHCGVQRYTFPEEEESRILIDLLFPSEYGFNVKDAKITKVDNSNIEGYAACESDSWSGWNDYNLYFVIKFSKPIRQFCGWTGGKIYEDVVEVTGKDDIGMYVVFSTDDGEQITVCSGLSLVSIDQARLNMESELEPLDYDFDKVATNARDEWNDILGRIRVFGGSYADKVKFYTNLYRAFAGKQVWSDVNGMYVDAEENIRKTENGTPMYGGDAFPFSSITKGGKLVFKMGRRPAPGCYGQ